MRQDALSRHNTIKLWSILGGMLDTKFRRFMLVKDNFHAMLSTIDHCFKGELSTSSNYIISANKLVD